MSCTHQLCTGTSIITSYFVVKHLVLLLHTCHECVFGKIAWARAVLGICALDLFIESLNIRRKQAMELEGVALFFGEC